AELATLVDRPRCLDADMARYPAGGRELPEELAHAAGVRRHIRVDLGVGPLQVDGGDQRRTAVPRTGQVDHLGLALADEPVEMDIDEAESWRGAPVPEQARLDVVRLQRAFEQRVLLQVDLADGEVVGRLPVAMHAPQRL